MSNGLINLENTAVLPTDWLPGYEVGVVIGCGGFGTVHRARQLRLERDVAVKVIDLSKLGNKELTARFEAEAVVLGKFHHPNIVQVFDYGYHANRMFIAMELLEGEDLGQRLKRGGKLDEHVAWAIARQCASALSNAATHGIVHRDIKPSNIFLTPAPSGIGLARDVPLVKVTDFGLALNKWKGLGDLNQGGPGTIVGSPVYMAPEQYRGGNDVDLRADIYALGATLFHALGGRPPFEGATVWDVMTHKLERTPQFWPEASRESVELIAEMMAPDPRDRIGSYEELLERIAELPAARDPKLPGLRRRRSPHRWRVLATAMALIMTVSIAVGSYMAFGQNSAPIIIQRYRSIGDLESLFNNQSIAGWIAHSGAWQLEHDDEKLGVLEGIGSARRVLPRAEHYRVTIGLDQHEATATEIQFAIPRDAPVHGRRLVLRIAADGASLGARSGERGAFESISTPAARAKPRGRPYVEVEFARLGNVWLAMYHGQEIGRTNDDGALKLAELRLVAEGGAARIDTVVFQRMQSTP